MWLFDNKNSQDASFVTGKAYFDLRNYDAQTGEDSEYILNGMVSLRQCLDIHCRRGRIFRQSNHTAGVQIPQARQWIAGIYEADSAEWQTVSLQDICHDGRQTFSVEFGGGVLIPFEDRYEELGCEGAETDCGYWKPEAFDGEVRVE